MAKKKSKRKKISQPTYPEDLVDVMLEAVGGSEEEMFDRLGFLKGYQPVPYPTTADRRTHRFAQLLKEAAFEPLDRKGSRPGLISEEPGPRYRTPVSPERVGPPAPYEYIGDALDAKYPRVDTHSVDRRRSPWPHHSPRAPLGAAREMNLRAQGFTPEPYPGTPKSQSLFRSLMGFEPPGRSYDTLYADPKNRGDADLAREVLLNYASRKGKKK